MAAPCLTLRHRMKNRNPKPEGRKRSEVRSPKSEVRSPKATRATTRPRLPTVTATAREIIVWLHGRSDPERARGVQQYFKHEIAALGVDTPALREFAAGQSKQLTAAWSLSEAAALCDRLLREPELEVRGVGLLILSAFQREFRPALTRVARRWLETRLDN